MADAVRGGAFRVGAGIVVTRLLGLVRERVFAHYFGNGPWADAFQAALKIPNVIRNLLGEGTLSASFIPVYSGMLEREDDRGAADLAGAVVSLLALATAAAALLGVLFAPLITRAVAPGLDPYTYRLTVSLVKIMFPMVGTMILSAWCLGVLNSHRRFFLPYAAPALWNVAQIGTLVVLGSVLVTDDLVVALAWGALAGGGAQFLVQLPTTLKLLGRLRLSLSLATRGVMDVITAWVPVVLGAGVMQISSIIDTQLGSLVGGGAIAKLHYAQLIAILPVSLFGVSVAASQLPEMSRDATSRREDVLRSRLAEGQRRIGYFVIPSALLFGLLGSVVVGLLLQTGAFGAADTAVVAGVLAAYAIGLPGQAMVKLLASGHYAMGDTKTPMKIAVLTLSLAAVLAFTFMRWMGAAGIALGSSIAVYVNVALNGHKLSRRVGQVWDSGVVGGHLKAAGAAVLAAFLALAVKSTLPEMAPWLEGLLVLPAFGTVYLVATLALGHPDAASTVARLRGGR